MQLINIMECVHGIILFTNPHAQNTHPLATSCYYRYSLLLCLSLLHSSQKLDVVKFIQGDLERLYMNGIEAEEYFQQPKRARMLLNVLFVWAEENPHTSGYRQGMHEIVAPVLLALEAEVSLWNNALLSKTKAEEDNSSGVPDATLVSYLSNEKYMESSLYSIFEAIMRDLDHLYKPPMEREAPGVVLFCGQVQDEMLRALDPDLCAHLEDNYVQAQLYGMRWSRLLLGREFEAVEESLFRIWDYIFASSLVLPTTEGKDGGSTKESQSAPSSAMSSNSDPLFNAPPPSQLSVGDAEEYLTSSAAMKAHRKTQFAKPSPILESLADFMLAMLLHIRDDLLNGDSSTTLQLLMRYPAVRDITPIIDLADMIRRGVLDSNAHVGAGAGSGANNCSNDGNAVPGSGGGSIGGGIIHTPTWLWKESSSTSDHGNDTSFSIRKNLQGVTKKMGQKISSVVSTSVSAFSNDESSPHGSGGTETPKRKTSIGTRNSLFGISGRLGSKENKAPSLFEGSPLGGESMVSLDKHVVEEGKSSVLVTQEIIRLAAFLESWTADKARPDATVVMPGVVSRLRLLSGLLDHSVTLTEYTTTIGEHADPTGGDIDNADEGDAGSVEQRCSTSSSFSSVETPHHTTPEIGKEKDVTAMETTGSKSTNDKKEEIFGIDFFANTFGLKTTEECDDSDIGHHTASSTPPPSPSSFFSDVTAPKSDPLASLLGGKPNKSKRDDAKIDAIFSDLTGVKKDVSTVSPFDEPFF